MSQVGPHHAVTAGPTQAVRAICSTICCGHGGIESAWAYQHRPIIGTVLRARQVGLPAETLARSWTAQLRLCRRFRALAAGKNIKGVVVTAIARELAGFLWAEMIH